jgi:hypothetical protein
MLDFESLDAACSQKGNPSGNKNLYGMFNRRFAKEWPTEADIDENGVIFNLPVFLPKADGSEPKWAKYIFPNGTCTVTSDSSGDNAYQSYKHGITFNLAGFTRARKEVRKHLNAGSVWIVQMKGDEYVVVSSSDDPIFMKSSFTTGAKGGDKRGYVMKGEADNLMFDLPILTAAMLAQLDFELVPMEE